MWPSGTICSLFCFVSAKIVDIVCIFVRQIGLSQKNIEKKEEKSKSISIMFNIGDSHVETGTLLHL